MNSNGEQRAAAGCTMTFENQAGERLTMHRFGPPLTGAREMCAAALGRDETYQVISYSTPETVHADLDGARADRLQEDGYMQRATLPERAVLARLELTHLLHPRLVQATNTRKLELAKQLRRKRREAA